MEHFCAFGLRANILLEIGDGEFYNLIEPAKSRDLHLLVCLIS